MTHIAADAFERYGLVWGVTVYPDDDATLDRGMFDESEAAAFHAGEWRFAGVRVNVTFAVPSHFDETVLTLSNTIWAVPYGRVPGHPLAFVQNLRHQPVVTEQMTHMMARLRAFHAAFTPVVEGFPDAEAAEGSPR